MYDGQRWEKWYPLGAEDAGDANHFNSFMFEQGRIWILAHNRGPSELMAFSLADRSLLERIAMGHCGHNIWRENGELFSCSSSESSVVSERGFRLETGGFPRGVAFDATSRCVGVSALAERKARDLNAGKLAVYSTAWTPRHAIELSDEGLVLDLMVLPQGFAVPAPSLLGRLFGRAATPPSRQFERQEF